MAGARATEDTQSVLGGRVGRGTQSFPFLSPGNDPSCLPKLSDHQLRRVRGNCSSMQCRTGRAGPEKGSEGKCFGPACCISYKSLNISL